MKNIKKLSVIIAGAAILSTSSLYAGFDDSVKADHSNNYWIPLNLGNFQNFYDYVTTYFPVTLPAGFGSVAPKTPATSVVPEPTTIIAGALLLLPLGVSTIRILRRNKAL